MCHHNHHRHFVKRRTSRDAEGIEGETPKASRGVGCGEGFPQEAGSENFEILFLKMVHFGAFYASKVMKLEGFRQYFSEIYCIVVMGYLLYRC